MTLEAYSVAVKLSLVSNVSAGLVAISKQCEATGVHVENLQKKLNEIKAQAKFGAAMFGTGAAMAAPIIYSISKAAELQKHMIAIQVATGGSVKEMNNMRRSIEGIAGQTVFSNVDVAKMGKMIATGTTFNATQIAGVIPAYARFADVQMMMKGTSYQQSVPELMRLAHTAQKYTPEAIAKYGNLLTKASFVVPGSLSEIGGALKYSQGIGKQVLGVDDESMILTTALLNQMGIKGSRGGTNLIAAMTRTIPGIFGSGLLKGKSNEALRAMGMTDAAGHSKVFSGGKFDTFKWLGLLSEYTTREMASFPAAVAREHIMRNMQHGFGVQGGRVASLLANPQAIELLGLIGKRFASVGGVDAIQQKFADEAVDQKLMNAKTNFTSAMTEIGYTLLPLAATGLTKLNIGLQGLITWVTDNPGKVKAMATAFSALSAALMFGGLVNITAAACRGLSLALPLLSGAGGFSALTASLTGPAGLVVATGAAGYALGQLVSGPMNSWINKMGYALTSITDPKFAEDVKQYGLGGAYYNRYHDQYGNNKLLDFFTPGRRVDATHWELNGKTTSMSGGDWNNDWRDNTHFVPGGGKAVHATINFIMDGRIMASQTVKHIDKALSQPQSGVSFPDSLMSLPSPANPF